MLKDDFNSFAEYIILSRVRTVRLHSITGAGKSVVDMLLGFERQTLF